MVKAGLDKGLMKGLKQLQHLLHVWGVDTVEVTLYGAGTAQIEVVYVLALAAVSWPHLAS